MILMVHYSNDRAPSLRIRTEIREEDGQRFIVKCAADPAAIDHVHRLITHGERLTERFAGTRFIPNAVQGGQGEAIFSYLPFPSLEEELDAKDEAGFFALFHTFLSEIESLADTSFRAGDDVCKIFGETEALVGAPAVSYANIDLVPANVLVDGDRWHVIDYEWTFDLAVPLGYLLWRAVHYYRHSSPHRMWFTEEAILSDHGITASDVACYQRMEEHFQHYISGGGMPLRELYEIMSPGVIAHTEKMQMHAQAKEDAARPETPPLKARIKGKVRSLWRP